MHSWLKNSTCLVGQTVDLFPLEKKHFEDLLMLSQDERIWEFYPVNGKNITTLTDALTDGLQQRKKGTQFPFVIFHKEHKKIVGSTRFLELQPRHQKLEIGATWLHPDYWSSEVNAECKLLLLTHCFEELQTVRVEFKTDERNVRSRKAIEKIGGRFEGILRNHMIRDNNIRRNSVYYSIIDTEWAAVKNRLVELYWTRKSRSEQPV